MFDAVSFTLAQKLFLSGLALIYLCAFWSLLVQLKGLYGQNGILPVADLINGIENKYGKKFFFQMPTIFWWKSSDRFMQGAAVTGIAAAILILLGVYPAPLLLILWVLYLSFLTVGQDFLSFQWDVLLVEVGFIAIFFSVQSPPPIIFIILLWFFLFRFMISSGAVKFLSKCPEWKSLKALDYHYETQPLPNRGGYYLHQQSSQMKKFSTVVALFLELVVPFFIFTPMPFRLIPLALLVLLQLLIMASGNYAFFNLLTLVLCIPLLDNHSLSWLMQVPPIEPESTSHLIVSMVLNGVALFILFLNVLQFITLFYPLKTFVKILRLFSSFHLVNSYGLFARMTTVRNEIVIEGSDDGVEWKAYEFNWKPGDLKRVPGQVAPHQPRLDWQMWFAALGSYRQNHWFMQLINCLLKGSPEVIKLLKSNPFPDKPPAMIRSSFYRYNFTDLATKRATGEWWKRSYVGLYSPTFTLKKSDYFNSSNTTSL